ncbi:MAG: extracellular solute-binding protein [Neomegalonema sp.]|nr:extracellular solute-binding protein [Neomegalonema sp.]
MNISKLSTVSRVTALLSRALYAAAGAGALCVNMGNPAWAQADAPKPSHGLAMHGAPALGPDFSHLSYADPSAPKGGKIVFGEARGFDSLNPYAETGRAPWHMSRMVFESLMIRSWDEPFTLYGLLASDVTTPADRSYVQFTLRPEAKFSNGDPVTVEDVIWTWRTLSEKGRLNLRSYYKQVARVEKRGAHGVRFVFHKPDRELPLLIGMMPILPKNVYAKRDFSAGDLQTPIGSGPYLVEKAEPGSVVRYRRNPDYWGWKLPVNKGRHNFDVVEHVYFGGSAILFEAFTAGTVDLYADNDPAHWVSAYDVPRVKDGRIVKTEIPHSRPSGMRGFVFNTRKKIFADRRVREAIALAFDFAWVNKRFHGGGYARMLSTFSGSVLGFEGAATGLERALLEPFAAALPKGTLDTGWRPPKGKGDGRNRRNLRKARKLLEAAGYRYEKGKLVDSAGKPFTFEILLNSKGDERSAQVLKEALSKLGVDMRIRSVDGAQYRARLGVYDFDMITYYWVMSLSPGQEQRFYWGSAGRKAPQSRNYMGVADPAVDAMIDALLAAKTREEFEAATRALDRVLSSGIYVAPFGYLKKDLVAHTKDLAFPARPPLYGHVYIDTWWRK